FLGIGIPEILCFPLTYVASYAFQVHERLGWAGALNALIPLGNLAAVAGFLILAPRHSLGFYLPFHTAFAVVAAMLGLLLVHKLLRPSAATLSIRRRDAREALGFSLMRLADNGLTSLDKTLVLLLAGSEIAGIYSSAYRLVVVMATPATSLGVAALPRLF